MVVVTGLVVVTTVVVTGLVVVDEETGLVVVDDVTGLVVDEEEPEPGLPPGAGVPEKVLPIGPTLMLE